MLSYEIVVSHVRGYYSVWWKKCQCQRNACTVLVFSSSNDGAVPFRILCPIL